MNKVRIIMESADERRVIIVPTWLADSDEFLELVQLLMKEQQGESDREWLERNKHILPTEKPTPF